MSQPWNFAKTKNNKKQKKNIRWNRQVEREIATYEEITVIDVNVSL